MRILIWITKPIHWIWMHMINAATDRLQKYASANKPDFIIGEDYLLRWWLIPRNRVFNVYLHRVTGNDIDRALHDHPWINVSIILQNGYLEIRQSSATIRKPGHMIFRLPKTPHRLEVLGDNIPVWSLFITGPRVREWGFLCPAGWRHWEDFTDPKDKGQIGRGCD